MAEPNVPVAPSRSTLTLRRATGNALKSRAFRLGLGACYTNLWWLMRARNHSPWLDWNNRKQAVFVHVPKNAGTSLYRMLDIDQPRETHCTAFGYRTSNPSAWSNAYTFAVCRNPWDRFVSAFHYLKHTPISDDDKAWSAQMLGRFGTFGEFAVAMEEPSFRSAVLMWRHFSPQWYFLSDLRGRLLVSHIVRFEALNEGVAEIARRLGQTPTFVRENAAPRAHYGVYYDERLQNIVSRAYARDIELFEYSFNDGVDAPGMHPLTSSRGM